MADDRALTTAIGDALLSLVEWAAPKISARVEDWVEKIADVVRPDPPLTIRSLEGHLLTGLLIIADRGQVVLFIGTRVPSSGGFAPTSHDPRTRRYDDGSQMVRPFRPERNALSRVRSSMGHPPALARPLPFARPARRKNRPLVREPKPTGSEAA